MGEGSSGKVTRMDGRLRIQDKVAADKRKDNKILGIVTIDRDSEEILKGQDKRASMTEEGSQLETKSEKEEKVKFTVKESKKLRSHTPEQEEYLLKLNKEEEEKEDEQWQSRPTSALGAVVKNDVKEYYENASQEPKESKREEKKKAKKEKKERKKEKKLEKKRRDYSRERESKERDNSEEKESSRQKDKHSKRSHSKEKRYSRDRDSSEEEISGRTKDRHKCKVRHHSREREHSQEREHSKERNKSRRRNHSEEKRDHSRGRDHSEESKLDRSPRKSPRSDRLSRIEADLKRGALSEWDLKRVTGGFEAKKWSWQKKKEEEMKAFLKYENLCNREKKSIAAKFAERDRLWLEEREKEREERRKEREKEKAPRRERTQSRGEKSKRER